MEQIEIISPKQKCLEQALSLRVGVIEPGDRLYQQSIPTRLVKKYRQEFVRGLIYLQNSDSTAV